MTGETERLQLGCLCGLGGRTAGQYNDGCRVVCIEELDQTGLVILGVLATFAVMSLLGIHLNAATIMVASVALGIAVDNTVHLLTGYDRARRRGEAPSAAVGETLDRVGSALVVTSFTACVGFGSLCVSAFVPIRHFGALAAISLIVALAADLLVVPALMVVREAR